MIPSLKLQYSERRLNERSALTLPSLDLSRDSMDRSLDPTELEKTIIDNHYVQSSKKYFMDAVMLRKKVKKDKIAKR